MKLLPIFIIVSVLMLAGCAGTEPSQGSQAQGPGAQKTCRMVVDEIPGTVEECTDVSFTESVCGIRKLEYSVANVPKVDLCISNGPCFGRALIECQDCVKAMSRCILRITNDEKQKSGAWSVGANYTLGNAGFVKDPITHTIAPGATADFDFDQIYTTGYPVKEASCVLFVVSEPTIEECVDETRTRQDCRNVSKIQQVQREVCE